MDVTEEDIQDDLDNSAIKVHDVSENGEIVEADYIECSSDENNSNTLSIVASELQKCKPPVFGHVAITDSENVQFGNRTYFNGPVTIRQIIQSNSGIENPSYVKSDNEKLDQNGVSNNNDSSGKVSGFKRWHLLIVVILGLVVTVAAVCSIVLIRTNHQSVTDSYTLVDSGHNQENDTTSSNLMVVVPIHIFFTLAIVIPLTIFFVASSLTKWVPHGYGTRLPSSSCVTPDNIGRFTDMVHYIKGNPLIIAPFHLRIVPRSDWLAQPETGELDKINQPVPWVVITHTATESCHNQSECVLRVRLIQSFHVESRGWFDIGYNFLVGGDGSAYYGRGWDYIGAHTKGYNKYSIAIAFIGTFTLEAPPRQQLDACKKLINIGVSLGKLSKNYKLLAHSQLMSTASPGKKLFDIIKEWPHFVKDPTELDETFAH